MPASAQPSARPPSSRSPASVAPERPSASSSSRAGSAASKRQDGGGTSITLHDTLTQQDVERTRSFAKLATLVALSMAVTAPLVRGHPVVKPIFVLGMMAIAASCLLLLRALRDPRAYTMRRVMGYALACIAGGFTAILFFGVFSPAPLVVPFGLFFFAMARSFTGTLSIYLSCAVSYAAMALPIAMRWLPDPGLVSAPMLTRPEALLVATGVEVIFFATFVIARFSRRATEEALAEHDKAVRAIAGRDALLAEARMDLEELLRARGLGRFTDEIVGGYHLGSIIGRGGMGEVYDAVHVDTDERAAVKLLHREALLATDASSESAGDLERRFWRECKTAAALDAPNVVRVLATSEPGDPIPFIAMERLVGEDLADYLRNHGRMRVRDVLRLIRHVGRGLDAARNAGIVHRDIKPRNIFLHEPEDGESVWKILDFGVSKIASDATLTHAAIVGTPAYMAPEQAQGTEVSHRTDLFSLAVIVYRSLTARPAFTGETSAATLYQVVHAMPPRPSAIAQELDPDIDRVLAVALAKDPWDRFDSATELADALERAAKGRLPDGVRARAELVLAKHPWAR
jgi:serine/threonine-protein kinase